ncbi:hypothetical protein KP79_PYT26070 [Mizuhopecten yessoensis]|uniref:DUF6729 domain-containing protein n=1 Tax=Mizuhopecten yessoensis TaxID=6573 RepID=A0A210PGW7_MIZYE|nr:hypothetical protein KP79_PYT26070 [Mizuhopecten yessoensis]
MAAEYLQCQSCHRKVISWKSRVVQQLDLGHRLQFPILMTHRLACDVRVITMLWQRGLGNSSTQLYQKLEEQHSQEHLRKLALYLTECEGFCSSSLVVKPSFQKPPEKRPLPRPQWLLTAYCQDVMLRLDEVKASITSTFGRVLKMDSTKKMAKKLAGHGTGTAAWVTNVGNEQGQVLNSLLTASEGQGLTDLSRGLVRRYAQAGVPPPIVLYVDRDCCGQSSTKQLFRDWPHLSICLDIWHFMRRFSAHPLYGTFMSRLSQAIFRWSSQDLEHLKQAKWAELTCIELEGASDYTVEEHISKKELASHCRRQTRETEETTANIQGLLKAFDGDHGCDTTGVPLFDTTRMWEVWDSQQRHVACIQDMEGQQLYTRTGTKVKGGVPLPVYRCARGSTSLESFHLHLNRFIPGTSASDLHFQAYLLEGLVRWNEDRANAALDVTASKQELRSYSGPLRHATPQTDSAKQCLEPSYLQTLLSQGPTRENSSV